MRIVTVATILLTIMVTMGCQKAQNQYQEACDLLAEKDFDKAESMFESIAGSDYKGIGDPEVGVYICQIARFVENGENEEAFNLLHKTEEHPLQDNSYVFVVAVYAGDPIMDVAKSIVLKLKVNKFRKSYQELLGLTEAELSDSELFWDYGIPEQYRDVLEAQANELQVGSWDIDHGAQWIFSNLEQISSFDSFTPVGKYRDDLNDNTKEEILRAKPNIVDNEKGFSSQQYNTEYQSATTIDPSILSTVDGSWSATSVLEQNHIKYGTRNLNDNDAKTIWSEGVSGYGIGEKIMFTPNRPESGLWGLALLNGHCKTTALWNANGRAKKISVKSGYHEYIIDLIDDPQWQYVHLPNFNAYSEVTITILEAYHGSKYEDLCIAELKIVNQVVSEHENTNERFTFRSAEEAAAWFWRVEQIPHTTKDWISSRSYGEEGTRMYFRFQRDIENGYFQLAVEVGMIDRSGRKLFDTKPNMVDHYVNSGASITVYFKDGDHTTFVRTGDSTMENDGIEYSISS